jgi:hypothetical protein
MDGRMGTGATDKFINIFMGLFSPKSQDNAGRNRLTKEEQLELRKFADSPDLNELPDAEIHDELREFSNSKELNRLTAAEVRKELEDWISGESKLSRRQTRKLSEAIEKDPEFSECKEKVSVVFALLKSVAMEKGDENLAKDLGFPPRILVAYLQAIFGKIQRELSKPDGIGSLMRHTVKEEGKFTEILYDILGLKPGASKEEVKKNIEIFKKTVSRLTRLMELGDFSEIRSILRKVNSRIGSGRKPSQDEWRKLITDEGYSLPIKYRILPIQPDTPEDEVGRSVYDDIAVLKGIFEENRAYFLGTDATILVRLPDSPHMLEPMPEQASDPASATIRMPEPEPMPDPASVPIRTPEPEPMPLDTAATTVTSAPIMPPPAPPQGGNDPNDIATKFLDNPSVYFSLKELQILYDKFQKKTLPVEKLHELRKKINATDVSKRMKIMKGCLGDIFFLAQEGNSLDLIIKYFKLENKKEEEVMIYEIGRQFIEAGII